MSGVWAGRVACGTLASDGVGMISCSLLPAQHAQPLLLSNGTTAQPTDADIEELVAICVAGQYCTSMSFSVMGKPMLTSLGLPTALVLSSWLPGTTSSQAGHAPHHHTLLSKFNQLRNMQSKKYIESSASLPHMCSHLVYMNGCAFPHICRVSCMLLSPCSVIDNKMTRPRLEQQAYVG